MRLPSNPLFFITSVLAALSLGTPIRGEVATAAAGELKIGKQTVPLKHVYALALDDVEGLRSTTSPKRTIVVLMSASEVPARVLGNAPRCAALALNGKLTAVEIRIDPGKRTMLSGLVFARVAAPREKSRGNAGFVPVGHLPSDRHPGNCELRDLRVADGWISGTALMKRPEDWPNPGYLDPPPPQYQFQFSFRAPVSEQPRVTAVLNGSAARNSPQGRAFTAMDTALRKGDLVNARRSVTPEVQASWDHLIALWGRARFMESMASRPGIQAPNRQIQRVVIRGDEAKIVFLEPVRRAENAVRREGKWLIDTP